MFSASSASSPTGFSRHRRWSVLIFRPPLAAAGLPRGYQDDQRPAAHGSDCLSHGATCGDRRRSRPAPRIAIDQEDLLEDGVIVVLLNVVVRSANDRAFRASERRLL